MTLDAIPIQKRGDLRIDVASHRAMRITSAESNNRCNEHRNGRTNHEFLKPALLEMNALAVSIGPCDPVHFFPPPHHVKSDLRIGGIELPGA
jgi:hypothetical protein